MSWIDQEADRKYHPIASLFPLLEGDEYEQLKTDIAANGLLEAIWLHPDGSIIDGRNRHRACIETETPPKFQTWTNHGSLVGFVVSMNLHRRHLSSSQRAVVALDVLPMLEEEAKKSQGTRTDLTSVKSLTEVSSGRATQEAAKLAQTNRQYVSDAKSIQQAAPDLLEQVRSGALSIPQARRELRAREHDAKPRPTIPAGKFSVIYADPPWQYSNSGFDQSAESHYPTMSTDAICALPIRDLAHDECVLFLWATSPLLPDAFRVMTSWGFEYKASRVWVKDRAPGMGWFVNTRHELLLIGVRGQGHPGVKLDSVIEAPVSRHSKKPEQVYGDIETCYNGPYIELFARNERTGWSSWGNEV